MKTAKHFSELDLSVIKIRLFSLVLLALLMTPFYSVAGQPEPQNISPDMSCGVCGMYPAKFVKWQTKIIFTDGKMIPFDGCKDMFKYILDMAQYDPNHSKKNIAAVWVKEFDDGNWLDGRKALFVVGSEIMGPMGKELIPFKSNKTAEKFQKVNGGKIMEYKDITMEKIKGLGMGGMKMKGKM